jgi:hypothetical protein
MKRRKLEREDNRMDKFERAIYELCEKLDTLLYEPFKKRIQGTHNLGHKKEQFKNLIEEKIDTLRIPDIQLSYDWADSGVIGEPRIQCSCGNIVKDDSYTTEPSMGLPYRELKCPKCGKKYIIKQRIWAEEVP